MARRRYEERDRAPSIRPDRIASLLGQIIQERIMRGFADPRIRGMISVTGVDVSPDLRSAIIRVSVLPESAAKLTVGGLSSVTGILRRTIRDETSLRKVPELEFRLDDSLKRDAALEAAIRERPASSMDGDPDGIDGDEGDSSAGVSPGSIETRESGREASEAPERRP